MWGRFVDAMAAREAGTSLALFRVLVAAIVVVELVLLGLTGTLQAVFFPVEDGGAFKIVSAHWLVGLAGGPSAALSTALFVAALMASLALLAGVGAQVAAGTAWLSLHALFSMKGGAGGAYDTLTLIALFWLAFARSDVTLSVACRWRTGRWTSDEAVPAWPRYLLVFQLALIYGTSAWGKLGAEWLPAGQFRAVYNALLLPCWARDEWTWLGWLMPLTQLGTVVSWLWELTWWVVPGWLVARQRWPGLGRVDVRSLYVAVGVVFHTSLWVLINVGPFSPLSMSFYVLLYGPDAWARGSATWAQITWTSTSTETRYPSPTVSITSSRPSWRRVRMAVHKRA